MDTITLNFTTKERYGRAVRHLTQDGCSYQLIQYGRYLGSKRYFGYIEFRRKRG